MLLIKADGSKWRTAGGKERPYRWYHAAIDALWARWIWRHWHRRQREFKRSGTRYYGNGWTIHRSGWVDVETAPDGTVCQVWFRCQPLPFKQHRVGDGRAGLMQAAPFKGELCGVEIKDPPEGDDHGRV